LHIRKITKNFGYRAFRHFIDNEPVISPQNIEPSFAGDGRCRSRRANDRKFAETIVLAVGDSLVPFEIFHVLGYGFDISLLRFDRVIERLEISPPRFKQSMVNLLTGIAIPPIGDSVWNDAVGVRHQFVQNVVYRDVGLRRDNNLLLELLSHILNDSVYHIGLSGSWRAFDDGYRTAVDCFNESRFLILVKVRAINILNVLIWHASI